MRLMGDALGDFGEAVAHCAAWSGSASCADFSIDRIPDVLADPQGFLWLELEQPAPGVLDILQGVFGLHELAVEDAQLAAQRPKLEFYAPASGEHPDILFLVLKPVLDRADALDLGELHVFFGTRFAVLLHLGKRGRSFAALDRFRRAPASLGRGRANALHAVLDEVVDDYAPCKLALEARLDTLEEKVISDRLREQDTLTGLYAIKRELLKLRSAAQPLEDVTRSLASGGHPELVSSSMRPYFRDVHDHVAQLLSELDALREAQLGLVNLHIALSAHRQGVVVRKLAGWGAILAVPTMVFSLYGMNFEVMPELKWPWGYPLVMVLTLAGSVGLHRWLRRSGWL
ncbi:MAG: magnesium and cobalt transport protein CorA [Pseudomonadota bacterium]